MNGEASVLDLVSADGVRGSDWREDHRTALGLGECLEIVGELDRRLAVLVQLGSVPVLDAVDMGFSAAVKQVLARLRGVWNAELLAPQGRRQRINLDVDVQDPQRGVQAWRVGY